MGVWGQLCGACGTAVWLAHSPGICSSLTAAIALRVAALVLFAMLPSLKPQFLAQPAPSGRLYAAAAAVEAAVSVISFAFSIPQPGFLLVAEAALLLAMWGAAYVNEQLTSVRLATACAVVSIVCAIVELYPAVAVLLHDEAVATGSDEDEMKAPRRLLVTVIAVGCVLRVLAMVQVMAVEKSLFSLARPHLRASLLNYPDATEYQSVREDDMQSVSSHPDGANARDLQKLKNLFVLPKYFLDNMTFAYAAPLFRVAKARPLQQEDMPLLPPQDRAKPNSEKLYASWEGRQSLSWALRDVYGKRYLATGMFLAAATALNFCGPLALEQLVKAAEDGASQEKISYLIAVLFLSRVGAAFCTTQYSWYIGKLTVNMTGGLKGGLFRKLQKLSSQSRQQYTAGNITNMFSVDVERVVAVATGLHYFWVLPLELLVAMLLLFWVVSWAMFAGLGMILTILLLNKYIAGLTRKASEDVMAEKDERMKATNEAFGAMLTVKLNAWEDRFHKMISDFRRAELKHVWKTLYLGAINVFLLWIAPLLVSVMTFAVYAGVMKRTLTAAKIFTAIALFRLLQEPLRALPSYITQFIQAKVSLERLQRFLWRDDRDDKHINRVASRDLPTGTISIDRLKVHWDEDSYAMDNDNLYDIERASRAFSNTEKISTSFSEIMKSLHTAAEDGNFVLSIPELRITPGQLCVVQGVVGSGKSSLLASLLGDMLPLRGNISVIGSVAYASQQAWIQNMTIRENVLFGHVFDADKYLAVMKACGLEVDLQQFPYGDLTEIGEKGINLSGGQRARIALARLCYADADICLIDDSLAALDEVVGKQVFQDCIVGLLQHKTRVLVTNREDASNHTAVDVRVLLHDGSTVVDYHSQTAPRSNEPSAGLKRPSIMESDYVEKTLGIHMSTDQRANILESFTGIARREASISFGGSMLSGQSSEVHLIPRRFVVEEDRANGTVSVHVYRQYMKSGGGLKVVIFLIIVQVSWQVFQIGSEWYLSDWSKQSSGLQRERLSDNLAIYSSLALCAGLLVLIRTYTVSLCGLRAARKMFDDMLEALMAAPMCWFDRNPSGRILNRMSEDQSKVDTNLPFAAGSVFATGFAMLGALVVTCVVTRYLAIAVLPVAYFYVTITTYYLLVSREVQRLQQISLSPVLNYVSESIAGLYVVRSFGEATLHRFCKRNEALLDENNTCNLVASMGQAWFILRIQCIGAVLLLLNSILLFNLPISAGLVGLSLAYGLALTDGLQSLATIWAWFENSMVSPERIQQYIDVEPEGTEKQKLLFSSNCTPVRASAGSLRSMEHGRGSESQRLLPQSGDAADPDTQDLEESVEWPTEGEIIFDNVFFRYHFDDEIVLKGITFAVKPCEKIGIVGRTGSGKTSITMALFRIAELYAGRILVDGVDIARIPLKRLRSAIGIVPQSPVLFKGSIRSFLDPFETFSDMDIWRALEKVALRPLIQGMGGLEIELAENGDNLSVGQRQMLVLSRALLRNAKILVMDEATASIDKNTDRMLQSVLRSEFRHSTVLTIAHRLETIMDSNRVMVVDDGRIVEFDPPNKLLAFPESAFSVLAREHKTRFSYYIRRTSSSSSLASTSTAEPGVEEREI